MANEFQIPKRSEIEQAVYSMSSRLDAVTRTYNVSMSGCPSMHQFVQEMISRMKDDKGNPDEVLSKLLEIMLASGMIMGLEIAAMRSQAEQEKKHAERES